MAMQLRNPKVKLGVNGDRYCHHFIENRGIRSPPSTFKLRVVEGTATSLPTNQNQTVPYTKGTSPFHAAIAVNDSGTTQNNDEVRYQAWLAHTSPMPKSMFVELPKCFFTDHMVRYNFIRHMKQRTFNSRKQKANHHRKNEYIRKHHAILREIKNIRVIRRPTAQDYLDDVVYKRIVSHRQDYRRYEQALIRRDQVVRAWCNKYGRSDLKLNSRYHQPILWSDDMIPWSYSEEKPSWDYSGIPIEEKQSYYEACSGFIDERNLDCAVDLEKEKSFYHNLSLRHWKSWANRAAKEDQYVLDREYRKRKGRMLAREVASLRKIARNNHPPLISEPELRPNKSAVCHTSESSNVGNVVYGVRSKVIRWLMSYFNNLRERVHYSGFKAVVDDGERYEQWLRAKTGSYVMCRPSLNVVGKVHSALHGDDAAPSGYVNYQMKVLTEHIVKKVISGEWQRSKDGEPVDRPFEIQGITGYSGLCMDVSLNEKGVLVPISYKYKGYKLAS